MPAAHTSPRCVPSHPAVRQQTPKGKRRDARARLVPCVTRRRPPTRRRGSSSRRPPRDRRGEPSKTRGGRRRGRRTRRRRRRPRTTKCARRRRRSARRRSARRRRRSARRRRPARRACMSVPLPLPLPLPLPGAGGSSGSVWSSADAATRARRGISRRWRQGWPLSAAVSSVARDGERSARRARAAERSRVASQRLYRRWLASGALDGRAWRYLSDRIVVARERRARRGVRGGEFDPSSHATAPPLDRAPHPHRRPRRTRTAARSTARPCRRAGRRRPTFEERSRP